jgi:hypothetical protein
MNPTTVLALIAVLLLAAILAGLARLARTQAVHQQALDGLQRSSDALLLALHAQQRTADAAAQFQAGELAAMHADSAATRNALAAMVTDLGQQNHATLTQALAGVVSDFNTRIVKQFDTHLTQLNDTVAGNVALQDKHRALQLDMAHHARRNADQMDQASVAFRALLADSAQIAAIGNRLAEALALLDPRLQTVDAALADLSNALAAATEAQGVLHEGSGNAIAEQGERTRRQLDSLGRQLAGDIGQSVQRAGEQTRGQFSDTSGKQQQQLAAMQKELNESLNKAVQALSKQLTTLTARMSNDLGPMAQQIRRVADQAKVK